MKVKVVIKKEKKNKRDIDALVNYEETRGKKKRTKHGGYLSFRCEMYVFECVVMRQPECAMTILFNTTASFVNCAIW